MGCHLTSRRKFDRETVHGTIGDVAKVVIKDLSSCVEHFIHSLRSQIWLQIIYLKR